MMSTIQKRKMHKFQYHVDGQSQALVEMILMPILDLTRVTGAQGECMGLGLLALETGKHHRCLLLVETLFLKRTMEIATTITLLLQHDRLGKQRILMQMATLLQRMGMGGTIKAICSLLVEWMLFFEIEVGPSQVLTAKKSRTQTMTSN